MNRKKKIQYKSAPQLGDGIYTTTDDTAGYFYSDDQNIAIFSIEIDYDDVNDSKSMKKIEGDVESYIINNGVISVIYYIKYGEKYIGIDININDISDEREVYISNLIEYALFSNNKTIFSDEIELDSGLSFITNKGNEKTLKEICKTIRILIDRKDVNNILNNVKKIINESIPVIKDDDLKDVDIDHTTMSNEEKNKTKYRRAFIPSDLKKHGTINIFGDNGDYCIYNYDPLTNEVFYILNDKKTYSNRHTTLSEENYTLEKLGSVLFDGTNTDIILLNNKNIYRCENYMTISKKNIVEIFERYNNLYVSMDGDNKSVVDEIKGKNFYENYLFLTTNYFKSKKKVTIKEFMSMMMDDDGLMVIFQPIVANQIKVNPEAISRIRAFSIDKNKSVDENYEKLINILNVSNQNTSKEEDKTKRKSIHEQFDEISKEHKYTDYTNEYNAAIKDIKKNIKDSDNVKDFVDKASKMKKLYDELPQEDKLQEYKKSKLYENYVKLLKSPYRSGKNLEELNNYKEGFILLGLIDTYLTLVLNNMKYLTPTQEKGKKIYKEKSTLADFDNKIKNNNNIDIKKIGKELEDFKKELDKTIKEGQKKKEDEIKKKEDELKEKNAKLLKNYNDLNIDDNDLKVYFFGVTDEEKISLMEILGEYNKLKHKDKKIIDYIIHEHKYGTTNEKIINKITEKDTKKTDLLKRLETIPDGFMITETVKNIETGIEEKSKYDIKTRIKQHIDNDKLDEAEQLIKEYESKKNTNRILYWVFLVFGLIFILVTTLLIAGIFIFVSWLYARAWEKRQKQYKTSRVLLHSLSGTYIVFRFWINGYGFLPI